MRPVLVLGALVAAATALRLPGLGTRSLWLDEAWVANIAAAPSWGEFWSGLQAASPLPPLFALLLRGIFLAAGRSAAALRALPLVASVAAVPLAHVAGRRWFGRGAGLAAAACFACYPVAVAYGQELKHYSTDVAVVLALLVLGDEVRRRPERRGPWVRFVAAAALAPGLSYPAALVLPGISLTLLPACRARGQLRPWGAAHAIAACAALAWYAVVMRAQRAHPGLVEYWAAAFPPPGAGQATHWLTAQLGTLASYAMASPGWLFALAVLAGYLLGSRHLAATAAVTLATLLAAAALHLYPLVPGRTSLFLLPFLYLPLGGAVARLGALGSSACPAPWRRRLASVPALAAAAALLALPARGTVLPRSDLLVLEETEPLIRWLVTERQPRDRVYVYYGAVPAFRFYCPQGARDERVTFGGSHRDDPAAYEAELRRILVRGERIWLVFSHLGFTRRGELERKVILTDMKLYGRQVAAREAPGASVHLFEVTRRPESVRHLRLRPEDLRDPRRLRELLGR